MRSKAIYAILLLVVIQVQAFVAHAQSSQNSERIRVLREETKRRQTAEVPDDLRELNLTKLSERRSELRALLSAESQSLEKYRTQLGTAITPEETEKIDTLVRRYDEEIKGLAETAAPSNASLESTAGTADAVVGAGVAASKPGDVPLTTASEEVKGNGTPSACSEVNDSTKTNKNFTRLDKIVCGLVADIPKRKAQYKLQTNGLLIPFGSTEFFDLLKILIAKKDTPAFLVEADEARLDKQIGGSPSSSASTSLVVKGGAPAILGFAVENGALKQSVNGTAVTFRGNPLGILNALNNKGIVPGIKEDDNDPVLRFVKKTSFAFTFNTDRGSQPGVFTATRQQLASVSARIEFINKRKPELYIKDWEDFLAKNAQPLANLLNNDTSKFIDLKSKKWLDPALQSWFEKTQQALAGATDAQVEAVLKDRLDKLPVKELSQDTVLLLNGIEKQLGIYLSEREDLVNKINKGTLVTFEYTNKREVNAPDTSNFMLIAEKGTQNGKVDFTFNGSLTMFNNLGALRNYVAMNPTLPKARRFRDFQFAGQIDKPFGKVQDFGRFVLFAGGRYERLFENASTEMGMVLPKTKGDIGSLQIGLKVPIKGTGFKIPISVTFANRTELVKEKTVRGNFGFTLDLDTLFAKFKPF